MMRKHSAFLFFVSRIRALKAGGPFYCFLPHGKVSRGSFPFCSVAQILGLEGTKLVVGSRERPRLLAKETSDLSTRYKSPCTPIIHVWHICHQNHPLYTYNAPRKEQTIPFPLKPFPAIPISPLFSRIRTEGRKQILAGRTHTR